MDSTIVSQDSAEIRNDADYIRSMADNFQSQYDELFETMSTNLTSEQGANSAWWGPQAQLFLDNFNKKKEEFKKAYDNMINMADNLTEQADAWDAFENA